MKNDKNYNIGLDIGVASVGWCVTDEDSNIVKINGKNMWGSRIFEEANTAKKTREFRSSKRRLSRRKKRIDILQSLMLEDMEKEYPNFFPMLRETSLDIEDKTISSNISGTKYNIFSDDKLTDETYYAEYPTIYHLRNYLVNNTEKVDIRLVYLAIHHIIKYRGNFLYEGDFANDTNAINESLQEILDFLEENYDILLNVSYNEVIEILKNKNLSKSTKKDKVMECFDYEKENKQIVVNMINSFLGYAFDLNKIFNTEIDKSKITFSSEIENEEEIKSELQDNSEIYDNMKTVYSWCILQDVLNGKTYISEAFIEKYNKYKEDLEILKKVYKEYFKEEYNEMFRQVGTDNYVAYNGKNKGNTCKKCKPEVFFAKLKKQIDKLPDECEEKQKIKDELEEGTFLKKLNVTDNGAIPYQLHQKELIKILENQSKYYKTLAENKEKIIQLFSFRIPYYVGPLSKNKGKWSWVIRKSDEEIRPWNFEQVVDEDATAEEFIRRMTNKCTYLLNEDVMPRESLLYAKFCVLNELNNIRVNDRHLQKDMKKKIIDNLFKVNKKVTIKRLKELLKQEGLPYENITGLSDGNNFNSNMGSYIDMVNILGKVDESNYEQCENLIYWITIFEDKKILIRKIKTTYPELSDEQVSKLSKLRYTGWSRLSKKLILGLKSYDGESIMDKLEKTNMNFMQIINEKDFGFNKQIESLLPEVSKGIKHTDIEEIPTSPANKRAIWQTICVVKEISKIMKKEPKNIYIEFAREEGTKGEMKDSRPKQLIKKYEEIEKQLKYLKDYDKAVYKELKAHQSDRTLEEKMYLYFIQNGKCLYSGKPLNIGELSLYEVDHILPQSYIKDDSIDNKALVIKEENQRKKDSLLLSDNIIDNRMEWWKSLLDSGLISQTKYFRLIRRKIFETDNDREKFVQRQLVETRQITKYVTNLFKNLYKGTNIFTIRSELTHGFRMKYKIYKNRNVNNYHHAHDAYILNIIGNVIDKNWKVKGEFNYSEYLKKYLKDEKFQDNKYGIIMGSIAKHINIEEIKPRFQYKDCFISRMLIEETGEFYNQTLYSPKDKPVLPLKSDKNVMKYGGYSGENKSYFTLFEYVNTKGEKEYQLTGIPIKVAYDIKNKKSTEEEYLKQTFLKNKEYTNFKILRRKVMRNQQYLDENNEPMRFCSDTEVRVDKELVLSEYMNKLVYLMNCDENKLKDEQKEELNNNYEYMFNYLVSKLDKEYKAFSSTYQRILKNGEKFNDLDSQDKKATINGLIDLMEKGQGNLKAIGLTEVTGRMNMKNFNTNKLLRMTIIDKSITGMYERRYKVNGLEDSSSK